MMALSCLLPVGSGHEEAGAEAASAAAAALRAAESGDLHVRECLPFALALLAPRCTGPVAFSEAGSAPAGADGAGGGSLLDPGLVRALATVGRALVAEGRGEEALLACRAVAALVGRHRQGDGCNQLLLQPGLVAALLKLRSSAATLAGPASELSGRAAAAVRELVGAHRARAPNSRSLPQRARTL